MPALTHDQRVASGRTGGLRCGHVLRRRAAKRAAESLEPFFSDAALGSLPYAQQLKLKVPDRTSPEDWPEAMLVTSDELRGIVIDALLSSPTAGPATPQEQE